MSSPAGYSLLQIRLHWAVMILVVAQFVFSDGIGNAFEDGLDAGRMSLTGPAIAHMAGGALIFILMALRLLLRRERGAPPPPAEDPPLQRILAAVVHRAIYALILVLPPSGAVAWAQGSETAADVHGAFKSLLLLMIFLHVAGAIYGHFVQKTGVIGRMLRPRD